MTIKNLVFSGGQIRGISYIGIIKALEELDLSSYIKNIIGVSAGAIFALVFALGLNSSQLERITLFLSLDNILYISSDNIFKLNTTFGLDDGNKIIKIFKIIINKVLLSENATFSDLYKYNPSIILTIVGTNLTKNKPEYFNYMNTPDMPLWLALRISTCVPIYFNIVHYNECDYIDGAFTNNFPLQFFSDEITHTIGIILMTPNANSQINTFGIFLYKIINCVMDTMQNYIADIYPKNTFQINIDYNLLELKFDETTKKKLIDEGYSQFIDLYKNKYCTNHIINDTTDIIVNNILNDIIYNLEDISH